jgi:hypothetical protein
MKVRITFDEWYPVFEAEDEVEAKKYGSTNGKTAEVTDDFYAEYKRVFAEFDNLQDKLQELSEAKI